jgi:YycE-like protein
MLGPPDAPYHLEFTRAHAHLVSRAPTADNLLAFYLPDDREWNDAVARMKKSGYEPVPSFNPYWDQHGLTFEDPDGYRVVLQHALGSVEHTLHRGRPHTSETDLKFGPCEPI